MRNPLFNHLHRDAADSESLSDEELKKQRIQFHRDHVRNGPAKFRSITPGMQRRAAARAQEAATRKTNRRYRRAWMAQQADLATLRGHLTILGIIECPAGGTPITALNQQESLVWVVRKYGERDDEGRIVEGEDMVDKAVANAREAFVQATRPKADA